MVDLGRHSVFRIDKGYIVDNFVALYAAALQSAVNFMLPDFSLKRGRTKKIFTVTNIITAAIISPNNLFKIGSPGFRLFYLI